MNGKFIKGAWYPAPIAAILPPKLHGSMRVIETPSLKSDEVVLVNANTIYIPRPYFYHGRWIEPLKNLKEYIPSGTSLIINNEVFIKDDPP